MQCCNPMQNIYSFTSVVGEVVYSIGFHIAILKIYIQTRNYSHTRFSPDTFFLYYLIMSRKNVEIFARYYADNALRIEICVTKCVRKLFERRNMSNYFVLLYKGPTKEDTVKG